MKLKIKRNIWLVHAVAIFSVLFIKIYFSLFMKGAYIFSDEQSYFGMADKIVHFQFDRILNSHMPGYPMLLAPLYALPKSSEQAYHMALIFNSVVGTVSYPLVWYACKYIWKMDAKDTILTAVLVSLSPSFFGYNYTVMSETLQTIFYLTAFVLLLQIAYVPKSPKYVYCFLGLIIGYLPIIKIQSLILLLVLIFFALANGLLSDPVTDKKSIFFTVLVAGLTFVTFRYLLFPNIGMYGDQSGDNIKSLFTVLSSKKNLMSFLSISFGEVAYFFVATGCIPMFMLMMSILINFKQILCKKKYMLIGVLVSIFLLFNIGITITHAYLVYTQKGMATVYARYLDFLQPIFVTVGMMLFFKDTITYSRRLKIGLLLFAGLLVFILYPNMGKIEVNTQTVSIFNNCSYVFYCAIFAILFLLFYFENGTIKRSICVLLVFVFGMMSASTIQLQLRRGKEIGELFGSAYYFSKGNVKGEKIVLDSDVFGEGRREDYTPGNATEKDLIGKEMESTFKYFLMFWAIKDNEVHQEKLNTAKECYVYTNKILPRSVLGNTGTWILYDQFEKSSVRILMDTLFRTGKGNLEIVNENFLRTKENNVEFPVYISNVDDVKITLNFADNVKVTCNEDEIKCFLNGTPMEVVQEEDGASFVTFTFTGNSPFTVENIRFEFLGKYNDMIQNDILYIGSMDISYDSKAVESR